METVTNKNAQDALAVLGNDGVFEVCLPLFGQGSNVAALLERCPALTRIKVSRLNAAVLAGLLKQLPVSHPQLRELEMILLTEDSLRTLLNDERVRLLTGPF